MPGTYWYHAHKHGKTNLHVSGGALGMLIIDASDPDAARRLNGATDKCKPMACQ